MLFDLTFPCYLTTFSGKKCLSGKVICAFSCPAYRSSPVLHNRPINLPRASGWGIPTGHLHSETHADTSVMLSLKVFVGPFSRKFPDAEVYAAPRYSSPPPSSAAAEGTCASFSISENDCISLFPPQCAVSITNAEKQRLGAPHTHANSSEFVHCCKHPSIHFIIARSLLNSNKIILF
jgi:hypothetical protein